MTIRFRLCILMSISGSCIAFGGGGTSFTIEPDPLGCPFLNGQPWNSIQLYPPPPNQQCSDFGIECNPDACSGEFPNGTKYACGEEIDSTSFRNHYTLRAKAGALALETGVVVKTGVILFYFLAPPNTTYLSGIYTNQPTSVNITCDMALADPIAGPVQFSENFPCQVYRTTDICPDTPDVCKTSAFKEFVPNMNSMILSCLEPCPGKLVWGMTNNWDQFQGACTNIPQTLPPVDCNSNQSAACASNCQGCANCTDGASCLSSAGFFCLSCSNCNKYRQCSTLAGSGEYTPTLG